MTRRTTNAATSAWQVCSQDRTEGLAATKSPRLAFHTLRASATTPRHNIVPRSIRLLAYLPTHQARRLLFVRHLVHVPRRLDGWGGPPPRLVPRDANAAASFTLHGIRHVGRSCLLMAYWIQVRFTWSNTEKVLSFPHHSSPVCYHRPESPPGPRTWPGAQRGRGVQHARLLTC